MNVLIINANESEDSYNYSLRTNAINLFKDNGHKVMVSDLYQMGFDPVASSNDFKKISKDEFYKIQKAQLDALENDNFVEELAVEMKKVEEADLLIFNFPLWWNSMPAIMKGWIDRVFAMGFAYGGGKGIYENGPMSNKKAILTLTTGAPKDQFGEGAIHGKIEDILYHINHGMLHFVGMKVLPPFVIYGASRIGDEGREERLTEYLNLLSKIDDVKPMYPHILEEILN